MSQQTTELDTVIANAAKTSGNRKDKYAELSKKKDESNLIDDCRKYKVPKFTPEDNKTGPLLEESSFSTLFPSYREGYLRSNWQEIQDFLYKTHFIKADLDLVNATITVRTTKKTWDPVSILKARDMIWLLSRAMDFETAKLIFEDDYECDIIRIKNLATSAKGAKREVFIKRRQRLIGPDGQTLKAIELLTDTNIIVQGNTVAVLGKSAVSLSLVRKIVMDCMRNIHPVNHIKALMVKRELEKIPELENEDWSRFLPTLKKKSSSKKKAGDASKDADKQKLLPQDKKPTKASKVSKLTSAANTSRSAESERNVDKKIDSGEYFLEQPTWKEKKEALKQKREKREKEGDNIDDDDFDIPSDEL